MRDVRSGHFFIEYAHVDFSIDHIPDGCGKRTFDDLVAQSERNEQVVLFFIRMNVSWHDSVYSVVCLMVNSVVYFYYSFNNQFNTDNAFVTVYATHFVRLRINRANPLRGPALRVNLMLARRLRRWEYKKKNRLILEKMTVFFKI